MILRLGEEAFPAPPEVVRAWVEYMTRFKAWEGRFFHVWDNKRDTTLASVYASDWLFPLCKAERTIVEAATYWGHVYTPFSDRRTNFTFYGQETSVSGIHAVLHYMGEEIRVIPDHCRLLCAIMDDEFELSLHLEAGMRPRFFGEIYNEEDIAQSPRIMELMRSYREEFAYRSSAQSVMYRAPDGEYIQQFVYPHKENLE
jgi:hypothetical protein